MKLSFNTGFKLSIAYSNIQTVTGLDLAHAPHQAAIRLGDYGIAALQNRQRAEGGEAAL